ncbi:MULTISPECIES: tetratricopeptide repeat protein [unclassified Dolichospermum]|uniref:tetratricopeptide repeat protein n=1 Tax=unclassified Dolichospermum TaxID=2622029 RepID=UPI0014451F4D|nr:MULTISPECIES: tetratricopeptide repeat protein [unclassified Dolichospermum]MTJ18967.1 tetratricopeptide repeat protein [Dolichospermum sp. UHCC 0299]MTJ38606.1 tetratricopeptide repeat protein [Dolichospermum sp. UHCC 0406]
MDWTTPLKAQQTDFIQRLKSAKLLHCDEKGQHSELTVISDERSKPLRNFCWEMIRKYKPNDPQNYFINNMKGKLGEEVVKSRLADFVTEVDYEKRVGGDGKVDFTLTSDSSIGIQVKARNGNFDKIQWSISREEIEKNAVLVCILIQEEVSEAQAEYNLILAGFLPTNMIKSAAGKALVGIDELLYSGGLRSYLESLTSSEADEYMRLGYECLEKKDYQSASYYCTQVLQLKPNNADAYKVRGIARYKLGDKQGAIEDCTEAIKIDPNYANCYYGRGLIRSELGDKQGAVNDYTQAIKIDPNYVDAYFQRSLVRFYDLGDKQGVIDDCNHIIKINSNNAAYLMRGVVRFDLGDKQGAIDDYTHVIKIDPNNAFSYYERGVARYNLKDNQGAIDDLTQVIKTDPNNALAYYNRGVVRYELGDKQGAIDDYNQAIKINPNYAGAYTNRGVVRYALREGDKQAAIKDFQTAANIYKKEGKETDYQKAIEMIREINK